MSNEQIKKAFGDAEKELQQEEIDKIKGIVRSYLEEIQEKQDKKRKKQAEVDEVDEEIRLLKKDLDDLKAGRLDKIEERQSVDKKARDIAIIIIKKVEKEYVPYKPWYSPYDITWNPRYQTVSSPSTNPWSLGQLGTVTTSAGGPWNTPMVINALPDNSGGGSSSYSNLSSSDLLMDMHNKLMGDAIKVTGDLMRNFVGGSYNINGKITNL